MFSKRVIKLDLSIKGKDIVFCLLINRNKGKNIDNFECQAKIEAETFNLDIRHYNWS